MGFKPEPEQRLEEGPTDSRATPNMKHSPASMQMSPGGGGEREEHEEELEEEPSEFLLGLSHRFSVNYLPLSADAPTINQATSNIVDGIDLDDIKEFAKAFKLRRLSLGLTQTQVGQALSVTEGPAYSQSAICRYDHAHFLTRF